MPIFHQLTVIFPQVLQVTWTQKIQKQQIKKTQTTINECDSAIKITEPEPETIDLRKSSKLNVPTDTEDGSALRGRNVIFTVPDHPIIKNNWNHCLCSANDISHDHDPCHDLVQHPEYWYEIMIAGSISSIVGGPCRCISFGSYMNLEYLHRPQIVALISLAGYGILLSCVITSYYVWTKFWTYRYPIPFQGLAVTNFMSLLHSAHMGSLSKEMEED